MKLRSLALAALAISVTACSGEKQRAPTVSDVNDTSGERITRESVAEETQKLVAERARFEDRLAAKREEVAADLAQRSERRNLSRAALMEQAVAEQMHREALIADILETVDLVEITGERTTESGVRYVFSGRVTKDGHAMRSSGGYVFTFDRKEGDLFYFSYSDDAMTAQFRRPRNGVCLVTVKHLREFAPGVNESDLPRVPVSAPGAAIPVTSDSYRTGQGSVRIISATYGVDSVQRDVRPIVAARLSSGRGSFSASNSEMGGDPVPGKVKTLKLKYSVNGRIVERTWREGERVELP